METYTLDHRCPPDSRGPYKDVFTLFALAVLCLLVIGAVFDRRVRRV